MSVFFLPCAMCCPQDCAAGAPNADLCGNPVTPQIKLAVCAATSRSGKYTGTLSHRRRPYEPARRRAVISGAERQGVDFSDRAASRARRLCLRSSRWRADDPWPSWRRRSGLSTNKASPTTMKFISAVTTNTGVGFGTQPHCVAGCEPAPGSRWRISSAFSVLAAMTGGIPTL